MGKLERGFLEARLQTQDSKKVEREAGGSQRQSLHLFLFLPLVSP